MWQRINSFSYLQYDGAYDTDNAWVGSYVSRISHDVTENSCGLTINSPNANDTGKKTDKSPETETFSDLYIFSI